MKISEEKTKQGMQNSYFLMYFSHFKTRQVYFDILRCSVFSFFRLLSKFLIEKLTNTTADMIFPSLSHCL